MTDRELLEAAAKAAGYSQYEYVESEYRDGRKVTGHYCSLLEVCINPLTNDADAFRLAVTLKLDIRHNKWPSGKTYATAQRVWDVNDSMYYDDGVAHDSDPYAATRRAIVRAAAEIGRTK